MAVRPFFVEVLNMIFSTNSPVWRLFRKPRRVLLGTVGPIGCPILCRVFSMRLSSACAEYCYPTALPELSSIIMIGLLLVVFSASWYPD